MKENTSDPWQRRFSFLNASLLVVPMLFLGVSAWSQSVLPEGNGKEVVGRACVQCHDLERVTEARFAPQDWRDVVDGMVHNFGASLSEDEVEVVASYLATNFPGDPIPPATIVPGNVKVSIHEWTVPNAGRPHDPLVAPDGLVWYTGIAGNVLGRFDAKTAEFREYPLGVCPSNRL